MEQAMATLHLTLPEFLTVLEGLPKGNKIVTLRSATEPKMLVKHRVTKEPNPYPDGVTRLAYRTVYLGANYDLAVNRQREREGTADADAPFIAEEMWKGKGQRTSPYTITHIEKGGVYFVMKPASHADNKSVTGTMPDLLESRWIDTDTGLPLTPEQVKELPHYLPPISKSRCQDVEADVLWRAYKAESIIAIHGLIAGNVYYLIH
jgi:hypothetical protein